MKRNQLILHVIFLFIVLAELIGRLIGSEMPGYVTKPLIMVWIALYFLLYNENSRIRVLALMAFIFSWAGDILLMFSNSNEMFFFAGVGGFFIAQLFYIITFLSFDRKINRGFLSLKPIWILPFAAYLLGIFLLLYPGLEGIMIPVILIYALSLIGMSVAALNRQGAAGRKSFLYVFIGSLFFVSSDSMIAIDKFYTDIPQSGFLIMLTYIVAQYLIMRGLMSDKS